MRSAARPVFGGRAAAAVRSAVVRLPLAVAVEWGALALWTVITTRVYLDFDPLVAPRGREYFTAIYAHFAWENVVECGLCGMWNGGSRGGFPAFADLHQATLHPAVAVPSLILGALNGAKIGLVIAFFLSGLAQWWLASVLGLGRLARLWSGAMAVVAGHVTGRMDQGVYAVVVSTVACALLLPALIRLSQDGRRGSAALLGIGFGLALVAGQGYLQIGAAALSPLVLLLIVGNPLGWRLLVGRYALAGGIGLLVAAPFLVPFLRIYPDFVKLIDPELIGAQPFRYVPLNLVMDEVALYQAKQLGTQPFPYLYTNYIGWPAVGLAALGVALLWNRQRQVTLFLGLWSVGAMWISSAEPLRWVMDQSEPGGAVWTFVAGMRHPALIAGLATPAILSFSAVGLDHLWKRAAAIRVRFSLSLERSGAVPSFRRLDLRVLVLVPAVLALLDVRTSADQWLAVQRPNMAEVEPVLTALQTPDAQWLSTPLGEEYWWGPALDRGLKLSYTIPLWTLEGQGDPVPVVEASRSETREGMTRVGTAGGLNIFTPGPGYEYAAVVHPDGTRTPCAANGTGGDIDVTCDLAQAGRLEVKENNNGGWRAEVNGDASTVANAGQWMAVDLPAGRSDVTLRYRPWDLPAGIVLMLVGLAVAGWCFFRDRRDGEPLDGEPSWVPDRRPLSEPGALPQPGPSQA